MKKYLPIALVFALSIMLYFSRILPHEANWSPVLALMLFSGFFAKKYWYALVLPVAALLISDWQLGLYPGWALNSISYVLVVLLGAGTAFRFRSLFGSGLIAACVFFLISNLAVWFYSGMYTHSFEGLVQCYRLALPFFRSTLLSTVGFVSVFYLASLAASEVLGLKLGEKNALNG